MAQPVELFLPVTGAVPTSSRPFPFAAPRAGELWLGVHLSGADRAMLETVVARCLRFTPRVNVEHPEDVLLEVAGSLKLFGSLDTIKKELAAEIGDRRPPAHLCAAPTAVAALWLARCRGADLLSPTALAGRLSPLPVGATRWPEETLALLREMGIRTLGDCLRLPRDGFARRVGRQYLLELDEALGKRISLREEFHLPQRLSARIELAVESSDRELLAAGLAILVERLVPVLRRRQAQVESFELVFYHRHGQSTTQRFELVEPVHDERRFTSLILDRLERMPLPDAAIAVGLKTGILKPMRLREGGLFGRGDRSSAEGSVEVLIERLRSRLGAEHVHGVAPALDHRPERAWVKRVEQLLETPPAAMLSPWAAPRPLWLLPRPLPFAGGAELDAAAMQAGPERIESGWWDGADAARDYYTLVTRRGERLWVYRRRIPPHEWFLHGLFG